MMCLCWGVKLRSVLFLINCTKKKIKNYIFFLKQLGLHRNCKLLKAHYKTEQDTKASPQLHVSSVGVIMYITEENIHIWNLKLKKT